MTGRRRPWWRGGARWEGILGDLEEEARRRFDDRQAIRRRLFLLVHATGVAIRLLVEGPGAHAHDASDRGVLRRRAGLFAAMIVDLRYSVRGIRRSPGFALAVVLTLGLGAGLNSTVFNIANALLLRDVPARDVHRLGRIVLADRDGRTRGLSRPLLRALESRDLPFSSLGAEALLQLAVEGMDGASLLGHAVTPRYFDTLGTRANLGRLLSPEDESPGAPAAAVVSDHLWRTHLGGSSSAIGRPLRLNGRGFTVVGVLEPGFTGTLAGARVDVWVPLAQAEPWLGSALLDRPRSGPLTVFARLSPGTSPSRAGAALELTGSALVETHAELEDLALRLDEPSLLPGGARRRSATLFFTVLQGLVLLVVLVAGANLTNLFLARAAARRRETGLRLSLGASRWTVARAIACEALLLALLGAFVAVILGTLGASALVRSLPLPTLPLHLDLRPDLRVLAVTFGIALLAGLGGCVAPMVAIRRAGLASSLRSGGLQLVGSSSRLRRVLVVVQVAVSLVLLESSGLLLDSLHRATAVDPGFRCERSFAMDLELAGVLGEAKGRTMYDTLLRRVRSLPGIEDATLADLTPLDPATPSTGIDVAGFEPPRGHVRTPTSYRVVGERYFEILSIPVLDGRPFDDRDLAGSDPVAIVNRTMAESYWPATSALGRTFHWGRADDATAPTREVRVIGVVRDVKLRTIGEDPTPHFYLPFAQNYHPAMTLIATSRGAPVEVMATVARALADLPGSPQAFFPRTLEQQVDFALAPARFAASVAGLLATLAVALSSLGLYGVLSYSVALRRRELGLRIALGAGLADLGRLVVGDGLTLAAYGLGLGSLLAWPVRRALTGLVFGIGPHDARTLAGGVLVLLVSAVLASWLPMRRALGSRPADILRGE